MAQKTTEQKINSMARSINVLLDKINQQSQELSLIKSAIFADKQLLDTRISVAEAAKLLGCGTSRIYRLINEGIITTAYKGERDTITRMSRKEVESLKFNEI